MYYIFQAKYRGESTLRELRTKILTKEEELKRTEADLHATSRERGQTEVG